MISYAYAEIDHLYIGVISEYVRYIISSTPPLPSPYSPAPTVHS